MECIRDQYLLEVQQYLMAIKNGVCVCVCVYMCVHVYLF